MDLLLLW